MFDNTVISKPSDFDFFFGKWKVHHHRLRERLTQCTEWEEFSGVSQCWPLLGGAGNVDDNVLDLPSGQYRAATLRSYDPVSKQWAIWWLDARQPHQLDVPVRGGFANGVGEFYANDELRGTPIVVRFVWSDISADNCKWQQAFSADAGKTWETNWVMHFTRVA